MIVQILARVAKLLDFHRGGCRVVIVGGTGVCALRLRAISLLSGVAVSSSFGDAEAEQVSARVHAQGDWVSARSLGWHSEALSDWEYRMGAAGLQASVLCACCLAG